MLSYFTNLFLLEEKKQSGEYRVQIKMFVSILAVEPWAVSISTMWDIKNWLQNAHSELLYENYTVMNFS